MKVYILTIAASRQDADTMATVDTDGYRITWKIEPLVRYEGQ